jgi:3-hydroxyisobutyrate dehydrogenase-like beta-hydroxyacid dehydrogenase
MSTVSPALVRWLVDRHAVAGHTLIAAPVFGRPDAVETGKLWIVAAGPDDGIARCRALLDALGQGVIVVGSAQAHAAVLKIAGNFLLASAIEALGEAFALVRKHDIDPAQFLEIVNGRVLRSPVYDSYGTRIASEQYEPAGFLLRHGLKDMRLAVEAGDEAAAPLPIASLIRDRYLSAVARGWGEQDWSALARVAAVDAGLSNGK